MRDPIVYAIPVFFLLILLEYGISLLLKRNVYHVHDAISDLGCGISNRLIVSLIAGSLALAYESVHSRFALLQFETSSITTWILTFLLVDLIYYFWHRLSHRVNFMWAVHVVHHQSEDYNLAVALRQALFSPITSFPLTLMLAVLGLPTFVVFTCSALNTVYQFWIHTELIGKLGPLEWVLNTPSHHRVHHGINRRYLDKNYAGVFIIWDRIFHTFELETERVVFGIVEPLKNWNPIWANFDHWKKMWGKSRLHNDWRVFIKGPEWTPAGSQLPLEGVPAQVKYETRGRPPALLIVLLISALGLTYVYLWFFNELTFSFKIATIALVFSLLILLAKWSHEHKDLRK